MAEKKKGNGVPVGGRDVFETVFDTAPYWQAGLGAVIARKGYKRMLRKYGYDPKHHFRGNTNVVTAMGGGAGYASGSLDKAIANIDPPGRRRKKK